jgi:flagellar basal-body rod protein FlgB
MQSSFLTTPSLDLLEQAAVFGERRHEALAGNIANISTPTYRMRDLPVRDFEQALQAAVARQQSRPAVEAAAGSKSPVPSGKEGIDDLFPTRLFEATEADADSLTFQDANNRSLETQVMEMTKNSMMQSFALQLIRFQMNSLQSVISERP